MLPRLDLRWRPQDIDDALTIQERVSDLLTEEGRDGIAGWKCALPVPGKTIAAPIYRSTVGNDGVCTLAAPYDSALVKVEPELAFIVGKDLPARNRTYSDAEVWDAVDHAAL